MKTKRNIVLYEKKLNTETLKNFKFLPGHEAILKSLPKKIIKSNEQKNEKKSRKSRLSETDHTRSQPTNGDENLDINSEDIIQDNETFRKYKDELINKIICFATKKNVPLDGFSEANILNFRCEKELYKCVVKCPHCHRSIPCNHNNSYWVCGNFTSHLKQHVVECQVNDDNTVSIIQSIPPKLNFIKIANPNDSELHDVLNTSALPGAFT